MRKNKHKEDLVGSLFKDPDEELHFILWEAQLNKDLSSFWKAMTKKDD